MRKIEFADLLVVNGVYSTRTKALAAIDAGKVRMQNVEFEDTPHVFPLLDAYLRERDEAENTRQIHMSRGGFKRITAQSAVIMNENDASQLLWSNNTSPWFFAHGTTVLCDETDEGAYESLMPGKWVKDTMGRWLQFKSIDKAPGEGCVLIVTKDDETIRIPWETSIYFV